MTITLEQQIALVEDRFSEYGYATDRAILASLKRLQEIEQQEPSIPEGYRLVPIEPTNEMNQIYRQFYNKKESWAFSELWKALVHARLFVESKRGAR